MDVLHPFASSVQSPADASTRLRSDDDELLYDLKSSISDSSSDPGIKSSGSCDKDMVGSNQRDSDAARIKEYGEKEDVTYNHRETESRNPRKRDRDDDLNYYVGRKKEESSLQNGTEFECGEHDSVLPSKRNQETMSLLDTPVSSSSSDDFAAFLDDELDMISEAGDEESNDADEGNYESRVMGGMGEHGSSPEKNLCPHPGEVAGMCVRCGQNIEDESGVPLDYIHKGLRISNEEMARIRHKDCKNLLRNKKLYLILDLDHTLLNSALLNDISPDERYLHDQQDALPDTLKGSLFQIDWMRMMTKLRPFVHTLLREANDLFEMSIYTMGERPYALEMAKLLDPEGIYFNSRIIAQGDCTQRYKKGLDVVMGQESAVIILDDTEAVWGKHKENLILMERYNFFASSCKHFGFSNYKSLSELKSDENETGGALATVLQILQRVHSLFFDEERKDKLEDRDVRQVLKSVQKEVLKGCKLVFTRVFPTNSRAEQHPIWKMAERLGATCSVELDPSVTHVVSADAGTDKSRWAVQEKKHLVHTQWIEASNYMWQRQPEGNFPVGQSKKNK